jgi:hypothetical protein
MHITIDLHIDTKMHIDSSLHDKSRASSTLHTHHCVIDA